MAFDATKFNQEIFKGSIMKFNKLTDEQLAAASNTGPFFPYLKAFNEIVPGLPEQFQDEILEFIGEKMIALVDDILGDANLPLGLQMVIKSVS